MAYRTRSIRRIAKKSRHRFLLTIFIIILLIFATLNWVLPYFIGGLGVLSNSFKSTKKIETAVSENPTLAPPIFNIPFEATNTAQIYIKGYSIPDSSVKIYLDDELREIVEVSADGSFKSSDLKLVLGTNNIFGKTLDDKNYESLSSKTIKIIYDNNKPNLEILEPSDNTVVNEDKVKVSGKTDPDAQVFVDGSRVIVNSEGNFNITQPLSEGENNINIKTKDQAGNITEISRKIVYQLIQTEE